MTRLVLVLLLGLAACATKPPPPPPAAEYPLPASRLARAAIAEWQAWGSIVVEGWPDARPADTAATPERFNRLLDYWAEVPGGSGIAARLNALRSGMAASALAATAEELEEGGAMPVSATAATPEDIGLYAFPAWSAAFISTVARRAGMPWRDLPSNARHARTIDALLARAATDPEGAAFLPFAPEERAPRPGDLLCADRSWAPLPHWSRRLADRGRPRPMHCDVVVRAAPGVVEAVGGNVQDMVVLRRFPADDTGRVLPAPEGRPPFVLLLAGREEEE